MHDDEPAVAVGRTPDHQYEENEAVGTLGNIL